MISKPEPPPAEPSPAESVLQRAMHPHPLVDVPPSAERQVRLQKAARLHTAAQDLGQFLVIDVIRTMGKVIVVLWNLVTLAGDPPKEENKATQDDHDKPD